MSHSYKMDIDGSGTISFKELGNYLIKTYCKQISLNAFIRDQVLNNNGRKVEYLNRSDFRTVINNAFAFLGVTISESESNYLHYISDSDKDCQVSFQEYFEMTYKYFCEPLPRPVGPVCKKTKVSFKLRIDIWAQLEYIYTEYVQNRRIEATETEIMKLCLKISGQLTIEEENVVRIRMVNLKLKYLDVKHFAREFLYAMGELGVYRFQKQNVF